MRCVGQRTLTGAAALLQLVLGAGPSGATAAASLALTPLTLAMRHGGFSFRAMSSTEADATLLAGAAKAEVAMAGGPLVRQSSRRRIPSTPATGMELSARRGRRFMLVRSRGHRPARQLHTTAPACGSKQGQPRCGRRGFGGITLSGAFRRDTQVGLKNAAARRQRTVLCVAAGRAGRGSPAPLQRGLPRCRAPPPWPRHAPHSVGTGMRLRT